MTPEFWGLAFELLIYASKSGQQAIVSTIGRSSLFLSMVVLDTTIQTF